MVAKASQQLSIPLRTSLDLEASEEGAAVIRLDLSYSQYPLLPIFYLLLHQLLFALY